MRHTYQCPLRFADMDMLGHVNNVTYVDYLQEARVDFFRTHALDLRTEPSGGADAGVLAEGVLVVRNVVEYLQPLVWGPVPVSIEVWVTEIKAATFTMAYEVFHPAPDGDRVIYLRASTVLVPFDFATDAPRRIRPNERDVLQAVMEPADSVEAIILGSSPVTHAGDPGHYPGHYPVHVRFSDVDVYHHVNNVKYFEYFQEARIGLVWDDNVHNAAGEVVSLDAVVARKDVEYLAPMVMRAEPYVCHSAVSHLGTSSIGIHSEIRDENDVVYARGRCVLVCFDPVAQRSTPIPAEHRERLAATMVGASA